MHRSRGLPGIEYEGCACLELACVAGQKSGSAVTPQRLSGGGEPLRDGLDVGWRVAREVGTGGTSRDDAAGKGLTGAPNAAPPSSRNQLRPGGGYGAGGSHVSRMC